VDTTAIDNVVDTIDRHGLADLQVVYFPGIDLYTHGARGPLQAQERYLADRSTCVEPGQRCDWHPAPRTEEDVLPVARAFDAANRTGEGVPALLGSLDMIMIRSGDDETGSWMSAA
jgi:hypothetical protein